MIEAGTTLEEPVVGGALSAGTVLRRIAVPVTVVVVLALLVAIDIFPIITNDSLAYLGHSNSIGGTGFVQFGYRQVGYPAFLASVDAVATAFRLEPLLLTVMLQRVVYLAALGFGIWLWRWRAVPLVLLSLIPSLAVYTNFILTEGLAIGLVLWYAALTAWVLRLSAASRDGAETDSRDTLLIVAGAAVGTIFLVLIVVRFQYILLVVGLLAVLYAMHRAGRQVRTAAYAIAISVVFLVSSFLVATARENAEEYGTFFPSVRGERSQFWAAWQVVFVLSSENQTDSDLADYYADGNPYDFMRTIDTLPNYGEQRVAYDAAMDRLLAGAETSWLRERTAAFLGVLRGGRIDDVKGIVFGASRSNYWNVEASMYRAAPIRREGIGYFIDNYNNGRRIEPVLVSALAPLRSIPYFGKIYSLLLVASLFLLSVGIFFASTRLLALVGIVTALVTALVFGYFLMDNVRFVLVPLMFVLAVSTGVADVMWRQLRFNRSELVHS